MMYPFLVLVFVVQEAIIVAKEDDVCHADASCWKGGTTSPASRGRSSDPVGGDKRKMGSAGDVFIQSPTLKLQHVVGESAQDDTQESDSTRAMEDLMQREQVAEINMLESQLRQDQAELSMVEQRLGQVERKLAQEEAANSEHRQQPQQEQRLPPGMLVQEQILSRLPGVVQLPPLQAAPFAQVAPGMQIAPIQPVAQLQQMAPVAAQGQAPQMQGLQGWLQPMVNNAPPPLQQAAVVAPVQGILPNPAMYAGVR